MAHHPARSLMSLLPPWQKPSPAFVSLCARRMGFICWAEVLCWDESFSGGCLCVFQGRHLELQTHGRLIGNELPAGLTACKLPVSHQWSNGPRAVSLIPVCRLYSYSNRINANCTQHAAPGFHCMVQPKSLLHSVAKGRVFFWLLQSL